MSFPGFLNKAKITKPEINLVNTSVVKSPGITFLVPNDRN